MKPFGVIVLLAYLLMVAYNLVKHQDQLELIQAEQKVIRSYYEFHKDGKRYPKKSFTLDKE